MSVCSGVRALLKFKRKERNRERKWINFRNIVEVMVGGRERVEEGEMMKWKVMRDERGTEVGIKIVQNEGGNVAKRKEGRKEGGIEERTGE